MVARRAVQTVPPPRKHIRVENLRGAGRGREDALPARQ